MSFCVLQFLAMMEHLLFLFQIDKVGNTDLVFRASTLKTFHYQIISNKPLTKTLIAF